MRMWVWCEELKKRFVFDLGENIDIDEGMTLKVEEIEEDL